MFICLTLALGLSCTSPNGSADFRPSTRTLCYRDEQTDTCIRVSTSSYTVGSDQWVWRPEFLFSNSLE